MLLERHRCALLPGFSVHLATQVDLCVLSVEWALQCQVQIHSGQSWKLWAGLLLPRSRESWYSRENLNAHRRTKMRLCTRGRESWRSLAASFQLPGNQVYSHTPPPIFRSQSCLPAGIQAVYTPAPQQKLLFYLFLSLASSVYQLTIHFFRWAIYLCEVSIALWFPGATVRSPCWTGIKVLPLLSLTFPWV